MNSHELGLPKLIVIDPAERAGLVLSLSGPQQVIGQSASADLVIDDPYVSGRHALVMVDGSGRVTIADLNSKSGTFVNGERVTGARALEPGDQVQFADVVARFEAGDPAAGDVPTQPPGAGRPAPAVAGDLPAYTVAGTVFSPVLPGIGGLEVRLVDKNVGGDQALASTQTVSDGTYAFAPITIGQAYLQEHHKQRPDLQVHVSGASGVLASSAVAYSAPPSVTLDVTLPADATGLPSEYEVLTASLAAAYQGSLSALRESNGRQDITYLANKTGWDARAVALAALADQFSQLTARAPVSPPEGGKTQEWPVPLVSLRPEFYYALFRAGLPASADALFRANSAEVQGVWEQAARQGIIPLALADEIPGAVRNFQALSAARLLTTAVPAGLSTLDEMLRPVLPEAAQRESFARLCAEHQGDWSDFWTEVDRQAGTSATERLRLLGQLYCLTLNNEPVVTALLAAETEPSLRSTADLAARGYYDAARWAPLIGTAIPPSVPGVTADEQAANYAELLAAQVRLSFPTGTIAGLIQTGIIPVTGSAGTAEQVASFLTENQGTFEIGIEPVEAYLARTGLPAPPADVIAQVSRLQRVYQLTPDDASMTVLLRHNLDSAFAITRYDAAGFTRAFGAKLGGADTAAAVHARARQIFAATLSIATAYLSSRVSPSLGGALLSLPPRQSSAGYPVVASATLENLFGSLDYCDCQDCGSILGPAAYLVDLLHYVDQPSPAVGLSNPQEILFGRRPDLQYLPLTCANTNTALPYIDLVNEVLEYFVTNGHSIAGYQGHDTDPAITSAELVASPQYVNDAAYGVLQDAFFPPPLPFNRPLALLRLHMNALGVALPDAMTTLRADDVLSSTGAPVSYGWLDILIERLGISRDEYLLFTDPSLDLGSLWGIPDDKSPLAALNKMSLRDFSRRLGVSYDDLALIVQTQFINPNAVLIPRLTRINVPFTTLKTLNDTLNTPSSIEAAFIASLPAGLDATEYGGTSPTDYAAVVAWVTDPATYQRIMEIITITGQGAAAGDCSGASLLLRYANPDDTANQLTAGDFTRLIRFVRLWRKLAPLLGDPSDTVSIQHTDDILAALYPAAPLSPEEGFVMLLARLGFLVTVMGQLSLTGASLGQLLACWAPIGTGLGALYEAMFLTPALLQQDPGAQTATVGPVISDGDTLTTAINGVPVSSYPVVPGGDTPAQIASTIAGAINAATAEDPVTGLAMNKRFYATTVANVITIKTGFTLACTAAGSGSGTYTPAATSPLLQTATVAGTPAAGDMLTTTINKLPVAYTVRAGDTPATIAAGIAALVNATTLQDPFSGSPLNGVVVASSAASVVTIIAANAGAPFSLTCGLTAATTGGYAAAPPVPANCQATITATTVASGVDTLITAINKATVTYTAGQGGTDTDAPSLAAHVAATVSASLQVDPDTKLPVSGIAQATSSGNVITFTPVDPGSEFTISCSVGTGTETYTLGSLTPETATATITAPIPAGATLTTTINGMPLVRTASALDTAAMLATGITGDINGATAVDPVTGLPLNAVVSAAADTTDPAKAVITVTGKRFTTPFTLTAAVSPSQYTAGRHTPPFADDGYGDFLADPTQTLFGHQPTLCAACNLTGAEFALIASALDFCPATPLTLENVSALFRFGWLAHTLRLSVEEFLDLRQFTRLDPFAPLDLGLNRSASRDLGTSLPAEPPVIRFLRLLSSCANSGLTTNQVLYLIWNQDINGGSAPTTADVTGLSSALRADFAAVEAQFTVQDDPDGSIAKGLMTLVYGSTTTDFFFGLLNNTFTTAVPYSSPPGQPNLPQQVVAAAGGQLSYNDLSKQLSYPGVMSSAAQAAVDAVITVNTTDGTDIPADAAVTFTPASMANIYPGAALLIDTGAAQETVIVTGATTTSFTASTNQAHDGTGTPFPIANDPALTDGIARLAAASQQAVAPFFAAYPELLPLYGTYIASTDTPPARRTALLAAFLPVLKTSRKQEQALASVTSAAGSDPSFASKLLTDPAVMHADADTSAPAVTNLTAIEQQGLSAQFFLGNDPAAPADVTADSVPLLSYTPTATVGGTITGGDILTTTINGVDVPCHVSAGTTVAQLAGDIVAAINQATAPDPGTGLPIGKLVAATASGSVITITGTDPSGAHAFFTLAVSVSTGATETYTAGSQLPPGTGGGPVAGVWSGYITAAQDGDYDMSVVTDPGATVTLAVGGALVPGQASGSLWQNQGPVSLVAGQLTPVTLTVSSLTTTLSVSWQGTGLGWQLIPGQYLYSGTLVTQLSDTYTRFLKATSLAAGLSLTAPELAYLAMSLRPATAGSWLNDLMATGDPDVSTAAILCGILTDLLDFSRIKLALSPGDERLLAVLQDPAALLPSQQSALLSLTGWSQASVAALLTRFFGSQDVASLGSVPNFRRVYDAYAVIRSCGLSAATLVSDITNAPAPGTVSALQSALRARYTTADWLTAVRPVNDAARVMQRDALVAYILQQLGDGYTAPVITLATTADAPPGSTTIDCGSVAGVVSGMTVTGTGVAQGTTVTWAGPGAIAISTGLSADVPAGSALSVSPAGNPFDTPDSLLEYFLVDVETQPPVKTSRIRLALSQVQLFIERVLLNLESAVSAADIDASRWEWMKRYRLWEANRLVFLEPENWLYPELRDDQSPFFQQMMSTLLQGDITDDAAASAYLDYLSSLEEVAKLEPCGLYYQPGGADANKTSYVVARTAGAHRKYYFRQFQDGGWTPWAQVMIDCEDMPVTPIVSNGRLFLFWLKAVKQGHAPPAQINAVTGTTLGGLAVTDLNSSVTTATGNAAAGSVRAQAVLCWTEYYNGKWQSTKTSDVNLPTTIGTFDQTGPGSFEAIRGLLTIVPAQFTGTNPEIQNTTYDFSIPPDALILAISGAANSGFILHNNNSLPVRFDDITVLVHVSGFTINYALIAVLDDPPTRQFFIPYPGTPYLGNYGSGTFTVLLTDGVGYIQYTANILQFHWLPRYTVSQPGSPDQWSAPFFYEDRRNLFYVTTTQSTAPLSATQSFGLLAATPVPLAPAAPIPPLALLRAPVSYHGRLISRTGSSSNGKGQ
jgi:hypothetical protein